MIQRLTHLSSTKDKERKNKRENHLAVLKKREVKEESKKLDILRQKKKQRFKKGGKGKGK